MGVDSETGLVHHMTATAANVHDVTEAHRLLHGGEWQVWGDAGYQGVAKRRENRELEVEWQVWGDAGYQRVAKRRENRELEVEWQVGMRPGQRWRLEEGSEEALAEKRKASIRAKVEHPFLRVKRLFGYAKVRYRGLAKNRQRLALLLGLSNLMTAQGHLAA